MTYLSDSLTIGLVIILLFGSIVLYLYTCIQQSEQKISLLESILLDIKMSGEIKSYSELPADDLEAAPASGAVAVQEVKPQTPTAEKASEDTYVPFDEPTDVMIDTEELEPLKEEVIDYHSVIADAVDEVKPAEPVQYENMILKDLQALAKSKNITGATSMKKNALIVALKELDRNAKPHESMVKPGSVSANSLLETSAMVSGDESA